MGQMTGGGQYCIVLRHVHTQDIGPHTAPGMLYQIESFGIGFGGGGKDHLMIHVQIGLGRFNPTAFGTGDGVARYKPGWHFAEHSTGRGHHVTLYAACIRYHGITIQGGSHGFEQRFRGADGSGQHHQVRPRNGGLNIRFRAIDHPQGQTSVQRTARATATHHLMTQTVRFQAHGKGAANQAQAHDHHAVHGP